uniref:Uncharacterized protein n=1 Tax=Rousettus aegyptiacus TaxID=9407 RepID=A0A7J8KBN5_ROUAE|nr:hypothetical protein HJG63_008072 [Rousettus aegyptiacus]
MACGGAEVVMLGLGGGCNDRRSFAGWSTTHLLLCGPVPDRPQMVPVLARGLGTPGPGRLSFHRPFSVVYYCSFIVRGRPPPPTPQTMCFSICPHKEARRPLQLLVRYPDSLYSQISQKHFILHSAFSFFLFLPAPPPPSLSLWQLSACSLYLGSISVLFYSFVLSFSDSTYK